MADHTHIATALRGADRGGLPVAPGLSVPAEAAPRAAGRPRALKQAVARRSGLAAIARAGLAWLQGRLRRDRRSHRRLSCYTPCQVRFGRARSEATLVEIGRAGCRIRTAATLDPGARVRVEARGCTLAGRVARGCGLEYAIRFDPPIASGTIRLLTARGRPPPGGPPVPRRPRQADA